MVCSLIINLMILYAKVAININDNHFSARIFNIYPRKGAILPGSDADIIILNPNSSFEITAKSHHSRSDTNVYEGRKGKVLVLTCGLKFMFTDTDTHHNTDTDTIHNTDMSDIDTTLTCQTKTPNTTLRQTPDTILISQTLVIV